MFKAIEGRDPMGILVGGYRNLGTKDPARQWSFKALEGPHKGKKVAEGDSATLVKCGAFVRESTRQRLVAAKANPGTGKGAQGFREVHAWVTGYLLDHVEFELEGLARRINYRPFERGEFYYVDSGETFTGSPTLTLETDANVYAF